MPSGSRLNTHPELLQSETGDTAMVGSGGGTEVRTG